MNAEHKPIKVQFQIRRNLSDYRKPRYTVSIGCFGVVADGKTMGEVEKSASEIKRKFFPGLESEFVVMAE